jgi:energy-coupling factor transporter transmembrane protein EcfT
MAHIHLPDGTFSLQWVLIWWGVALVLIAIALRSARFYGSVFASTFIRSFDRAEHISKAMASRGYSGKFQSTYSPPKPSFAGYLTIVLLLIASYYVSIPGGGL